MTKDRLQSTTYGNRMAASVRQLHTELTKGSGHGIIVEVRPTVSGLVDA